MNIRAFFPLGKAYGEAFCNRNVESKKLMSHLKSGKHTLLIAPRRYGKSSLCEQALLRSKLPWSKVDFHLAITEKEVEQFIIKAITELIGKSIGKVDRLVAVIKNFVKTLKPKFTLTSESMGLELEVSSNSTPAENISEAILLFRKNAASEKEAGCLIVR
jgi:uncharacterized protein